jgi:GNAT superfamily N-acetyltransferase
VPTDSIEIRHATDADLPAVVALAARSLGWLGDDADAAFFRWKHLENSFGRSPMWVAEHDGRVVALRTFLRWELVDERGRVLRAVRAVDTATDPDYQGRGLFRRLTMHALDELRAEGVDLVFNTPNAQSLPGYLKMGWIVVGRLPAAFKPTRLGALPSLLAARRAASRGAIAVHVGLEPAEAFADAAGVEALLASQPPPHGLATHQSLEQLRWRYGHAPLHYRIVTLSETVRDGIAAFHLRRRGPCVEAVVCSVLAPGASANAAAALRRQIARLTGADYLLRIEGQLVSCDGFVRLPSVGPLLTARALRPDVAVRPIDQWRLSMGDIELF